MEVILSFSRYLYLHLVKISSTIVEVSDPDILLCTLLYVPTPRPTKICADEISVEWVSVPRTKRAAQDAVVHRSEAFDRMDISIVCTPTHGKGEFLGGFSNTRSSSGVHEIIRGNSSALLRIYSYTVKSAGTLPRRSPRQFACKNRESVLFRKRQILQ
jgi:hypothetical protein